jgi:hypothetical protein
MKRALFLALLLCGGCAVADVWGVGWHAHVVTVWKDPKLDGLKLVTQTPTTRQSLNVQDYSSESKFTGADFSRLAVTALRFLLVVP